MATTIAKLVRKNTSVTLYCEVCEIIIKKQILVLSEGDVNTDEGAVSRVSDFNKVELHFNLEGYIGDGNDDKLAAGGDIDNLIGDDFGMFIFKTDEEEEMYLHLENFVKIFEDDKAGDGKVKVRVVDCKITVLPKAHDYNQFRFKIDLIRHKDA